MMSPRCLLLLVLAPATMAVRARFAADSAPASAVHVVDKIGSLLQAHLDKSQSKVRRTMHAVHLSTQRVSEETTPEAKESLNNVLVKVIEAIKTSVDQQIVADHQKTQELIVERVQEVQRTNGIAVTSYEKALVQDSEWLDCIDKERTLLEASEAAERSLSDSRSNENEACQLEQDTAQFSDDAPVEDLAYTCDTRIRGDCGRTATTNFNAAVDKYLADLETAVDDAEKKHADATIACAEAKNAQTQAQSATSEAKNAWADQRDQCVGVSGARTDAMCLFGTKLQMKCSQLHLYESLMEEIDRSDGGQNSHSDRKQQWRASQVTQCMLNKIMTDFQINSLTMEACDKAVDFDEASFGKLDRKTKEIAESTPENFSCKDAQISFKGITWIVPDGDDIKSEDYIRERWAPDAPVAGETDSFSFCENEPRGKR